MMNSCCRNRPACSHIKALVPCIVDSCQKCFEFNCNLIFNREEPSRRAGWNDDWRDNDWNGFRDEGDFRGMERNERRENREGGERVCRERDELRVGTVIPCKLCGKVKVEEVSCVENRNCRATTVLFKLPVRFMREGERGEMEEFNNSFVTDIRTFALRHADRSKFELLDIDIQSITAVVTAIEDDEITVSVNVVCNAYVGQVINREVVLEEARPIPVPPCRPPCIR